MNPLNNNNQNQEKNKQKKATSLTNPISRLAYTMAKITLRFNLLFNEFIEMYKFHLVTLAHKQNPKHSMVELSARTGLDRRYVSDTIKNETLKKINTKVQLVLKQLRQVCIKNNCKKIAKYGEINSFKSICEQVSSGSLTYSAIAKELLRLGEIIDNGRKYEVVNSEDASIEKSLQLYLASRKIHNECLQYCQLKKSKSIAKYGKRESFENIYNKFDFKQITKKEIVSELISHNQFKDMGEFYKLESWRYRPESKDSYLLMLSIELQRLAETFFENLNQKTLALRKIQRNVYSTKIKPKDFKLVHKELCDYFNNVDEKIIKIFTSYDNNVPSNTYPSFGLSIFTFGPDHNLDFENKGF